MKARCRCGHIIEYPPQKQGKRTKCPNCGKPIRPGRKFCDGDCYVDYWRRKKRKK